MARICEGVSPRRRGEKQSNIGVIRKNNLTTDYTDDTDFERSWKIAKIDDIAGIARHREGKTLPRMNTDDTDLNLDFRSFYLFLCVLCVLCGEKRVSPRLCVS